VLAADLKTVAVTLPIKSYVYSIFSPFCAVAEVRRLASL